MIKLNQLMEMEISYVPSPIQINEEYEVKSSFAAYSYLITMFNPKAIACQEEFLVMFLNRSNNIIGIQKLSKGGVHSTVVDKKLIFAAALKSLSSGIILAHNHPSGNLKPSEQDISITKSIKEAGKLLDIEVLDHIIVSPKHGAYHSMADNGEL
jgi:DNA repair protein RadC